MSRNRHHLTTRAIRPGQRISVSTPWGIYHGTICAVHPEGVWMVSPHTEAPPIIPLNRAAVGELEPAFFGLFKMLPIFGGRGFRPPSAPPAPSVDGWAPGPPFTAARGAIQPAGPWHRRHPGAAPPPAQPSDRTAAGEGSSRGFLGFLSGRNRFWWLPLAFYGLRLFF